MVHSPIVKDCIIIRALKGLPPRSAVCGPRSRSEILHKNEDIEGTATVVHSPIVKDCIIIRALKGLPPRSAVCGPRSRSEILHKNEDIEGTATAVHSPVVKDCIIMKTVYMDCHCGPQSHSERLSWLTAIL